MSLRRTLVFALLLGLGTPAAARADGMFTPFIGVNFGGSAGRQPIADAIDAERLDWGASLAWMGAGIFGFEADLGYSPDFFGRSDAGGSSVLSAMGNVLIGIPLGGQTGFGVRPYGLAGLGVVQSKIDSGLDETKGAWDFGGGVMLFFGTHVGLRGDLRYIRTIGRLDFDVTNGIERSRRLDFGRASAGLILRF